MPNQSVLKTPPACFQQLPDYPFKENYTDVTHPHYGTLKMHYVDEQLATAKAESTTTVLLLHGCPSWSYLYRKIIPPLVSAGHRVIAPDHIGCGKSDKLPNREDYTYDYYVNWLKQLIVNLELANISLVCQDWGGPIGLRTVADRPDFFSRIVVTNTLLPNAEAPPHGISDWPGDIIKNWIQFTANADDLSIGDIMQGVTVTELSTATMAAYDAPFPDASYKQGVLNWPSLIPTTKQSPGILENRHAWRILEALNIPVLTAFSDSDPTTADWESVFQTRLRGAQGVPHQVIANSGHMLQEDNSPQLSNIISEFIKHY